jgi:uncharacterized membrane protein YfhO
MGIDHWLKIVLAGSFFFKFLEERDDNTWFHLILALGYAFSGHMVLRSSWSSYPEEAVLVALWLWAFELWFQKKDLRWVILATVFFMHYKSSTYNLLLYGALMVAYVFLRYVTERKIPWKILGISAAAMILLLGAYLAATKFAIINNVLSMLGSTRAQNQMAATDWSIQGFLPDLTLFPTLFFRTVGMNIIGGARGYAGESNMLEDPTFYCGLFVLLLIPMAFYCMKMRQRIWYLLYYVVAFIYCFCDNIRVILNGFANDTFKLSSFWILVLLLLTVSQIDWKRTYTTDQRAVAAGCVAITAMLIITVMLRTTEDICVLDDRLRISILFIVLEGIFFILCIRIGRGTRFWKIALAGCALAEVLAISYPIYNDRDTADASAYQDGTQETVEYLKSIDSSFYRIDKQYLTVSQCDSLAQGYYGLSSYVGGLGIGDRYLNFCYDLNLIEGNDIRLLSQPSGYNEVETLLGVKYILSRSSVANYGYVPIGQTGDITIYENEYAVPMGFVYHKQISRDSFESLSYKQRQQVLLKAFVCDTPVEQIPYIEDEEIQKLDDQLQLTDEYAVYIEYSVEDYKFHFEPNSEQEMLAIRIHFADKEGAYATIRYNTTDDQEGEIQIIDLDGAGEQIFEVSQANVDRIWVETKATFDFIQVSCIPRELYYGIYVSDMEQNMEDSVQLTVCETDYMQGTVQTEEAGILYLPIANNKWHVFVDGEEAGCMYINDAFPGVYIEAGEHVIELKYNQLTYWQIYENILKKILLCAVSWIALTIIMHQRRGRMEHDRNISSGTGL